MSRSKCYETMKQLAAEKRAKHGISTSTLGLQKVRDVYKSEGVQIDLRETSHRIRAVYMCDDGDPSV